jgi:hypothetical protein
LMTVINVHGTQVLDSELVSLVAIWSQALHCAACFLVRPADDILFGCRLSILYTSLHFNFI